MIRIKQNQTGHVWSDELLVSATGDPRTGSWLRGW